MFGYAALRLLPAMNRILNAVTNLRFGLAAAEIVRADLHDAECEVMPEHVGSLTFERSVDLDAVSFRYPGIGHAGARRHRPLTANRIVARHRRANRRRQEHPHRRHPRTPDTGMVTVDGVDGVDGVDVRSAVGQWHRLVGLVPQTIFLVDDTLRRNIAFLSHDTEINEARLARAVRMAQLDDVVAGLPHGLDTVVGERGARLSGGQRQRVVIARALYREPSLIVFDEGTSALGSATEADLLAALDALSGSHTVVMVAHRLSTVRHCDQVVVLDGGHIVACGTYDELPPTSQLFQRLSAS